MEREDVENMVDARLAAALGPITGGLAELKSRIIGIDGNGTGREGELQRQNTKLTNLDDGQKFMIEQLHTITTRQENWSKKKFWTLIRWGIPIIITLLALALSYAGYRIAQNKSIATTRVIRETIPADASN